MCCRNGVSLKSADGAKGRKWGLSQVLVLPFTMLFRVYQLVISSWTGPSCRYLPTCSAYGIEAFKRHGLFRGAWLTVKRLLRCHPWSKGGYDPVP